MFGIATKTIKDISIFGVVYLVLLGLGEKINSWIQWEWITYFFVIIRKALSFIDFMVDTNALFSVLFMIMTAQIAVIIVHSSQKIIAWFR